MKFNYWQKLEPECYYHIYNRAIGSEVLFRDEVDYQFFLKKYSEYLHPYFKTYAYCLMPNHFHLIVKVKLGVEIELGIKEEVTKASYNYAEGRTDLNNLLTDQMRRLFSSYVLKFNNRHSRKGPLITPKVKRVWIRNNDRLKYLIAYTHHNPIHHKLKLDFREWNYSSFKAFCSDKKTLLSRTDVLNLYGGLNKFKEFHRAFQVEKSEENID